MAKDDITKSFKFIGTRPIVPTGLKRSPVEQNMAQTFQQSVRFTEQYFDHHMPMPE